MRKLFLLTDLNIFLGFFINTIIAQEAPANFTLKDTTFEIGQQYTERDIGFRSINVFTEKSKLALDELYQFLQNNPQLIIEFGTHTDSRGSVLYNKELSQKWGELLVRYFQNLGIKEDRLIAVGYGEEQLIYQDKEISQAGSEEKMERLHSLNRRIVVKIIKISGQ